jgi:hypothetical protein
MTQEDAQKIVRLALDGDSRYSHDSIGREDQDINDMAAETGGVLVDKAIVDTDIAIYDCGSHWELVADCNGPISVCVVKS